MEDKVNSDRAAFFGISPDIPNHVSGFVFIGGNIAFIMILQFLVSFLRKNNYLRKLIEA